MTINGFIHAADPSESYEDICEEFFYNRWDAAVIQRPRYDRCHSILSAFTQQTFLSFALCWWVRVVYRWNSDLSKVLFFRGWRWRYNRDSKGPSRDIHWSIRHPWIRHTSQPSSGMHHFESQCNIRVGGTRTDCQWVQQPKKEGLSDTRTRNSNTGGMYPQSSWSDGPCHHRWHLRSFHPSESSFKKQISHVHLFLLVIDQVVQPLRSEAVHRIIPILYLNHTPPSPQEWQIYLSHIPEIYFMWESFNKGADYRYRQGDAVKDLDRAGISRASRVVLLREFQSINNYDDAQFLDSTSVITMRSIESIFKFNSLMSELGDHTLPIYPSTHIISSGV